MDWKGFERKRSWCSERIIMAPVLNVRGKTMKSVGLNTRCPDEIWTREHPNTSLELRHCSELFHYREWFMYVKFKSSVYLHNTGAASATVCTLRLMIGPTETIPSRHKRPYHKINTADREIIFTHVTASLYWAVPSKLVREVPGSNSGWATDYPEWHFSWLSQSSTKRQGDNPKLDHDYFLPDCSQFIIQKSLTFDAIHSEIFKEHR